MTLKNLRRGCAVLLLVAAPLAAAAREGAGGRTVQRSFPVASGQDIQIDMRWGELEIEPTDGDKIELVATLECRGRDSDERCPERLRDIDIESDEHDDALRVQVTGQSRWGNCGAQVRVVARVPRQHALAIDMGAGEVSIEGFGADLEVDLGAGEIRVRMPEDSVRRVDLSAGVGETALRRRDGVVEDERRRHLVGGSVRWAEGHGRARVDCRVGAGEVDVRLD